MTTTQILAIVNHLNNKALEHNHSARPDSALFEIHMTCSMICTDLSGALLEALKVERSPSNAVAQTLPCHQA